MGNIWSFINVAFLILINFPIFMVTKMCVLMTRLIAEPEVWRRVMPGSSW